MDIPLPGRDALKAQARRLRMALQSTGTPCTHSQALEAIAQQWGARDWNTLSARTQTTATARFVPGQRVSGRYLGHPFVGGIKAARLMPRGRHQLTVRFDRAIDVVTSTRFSALRQQINCTVTQDGRSIRKTSDGQPHLVIHTAWSGGATA